MSRPLRVTLLADEWKSSKGGLSTMNRELAIQLAKHPIVAVTFFVPKCTENDREESRKHNISIVEAKERPGYDPLDWLSFPPRDLIIDIIIGHGVKLGKQAQVIKDSHHCAWIQVVHTAPEEHAMLKNYSGAVSKGDEKQWTEVNLCRIADLVVAVGPKLHEVYSGYLNLVNKRVFNLTPGILTELSTLKLFTPESKKFRVLVFGRGDSEDFELKGFDIAAKAVAELHDDPSYSLTFVGAPSGNQTLVAGKLLEQGISRSRLTVKTYLENRDDLATLLSRANLAIIPSRTEGFGLTALEALSAGLPFLVSQNSGFGEALEEIPSGSPWIVDSEDPKDWAKAIKAVREKGRETAVKECQELRTLYAAKYSWNVQCNDLVGMMLALIHESASEKKSEVRALSHNRSQAPNQRPDYFTGTLKEGETRKRAEEQKLELELCRRRDELYKYRFGDKIRLDSFRGLSIEDVTRLRIGVFGPTGSGISCFINMCERVVRQTEMGAAVFGATGQQVTVALQDYLPEMFFHLVDTKGFFSQSENTYAEFRDILFGKLQPGDKIECGYDVASADDEVYQCPQCPMFGDRIHGVIFVIKGNSPCLLEGALQNWWKPLRDLLRKIGIEPITIVTKRDTLKEEEDREIAFDEAKAATGSSTSHTFFMENFIEENKARNPEKERNILEILHCALTTAERAVKTMKQNVDETRMARGKIDEASLRRETRESGERQLANERLQREIEEEIRILNEKQKEEDERQEAECQQQRQREIEQEQTRRREEELKRSHLQAKLCQCLSELSRFKEREMARKRGEEPNLLDNVGRETERMQQQIEDEICKLSEKRKADEEKRQHEENLTKMQREVEFKEVKRRQENLKRLQLEADLCRRRDELFNYRFGEKTRLDCLQGIQIDDITNLRIGVFGPRGSGKSCFIKTCERALRLTETRSALDRTTGQVDTNLVQEYLPEMFFRLVEVSGVLSKDCVNTVVLRNMMFGNPEPVGDREHEVYAGETEIHRFPWLEEKLHGIIFVFKAKDPQLNIKGLEEDMCRLIRDIRHNHGIEPITVVTHQDKLSSEEECSDACADLWCITRSYWQYTFLVSNYTEVNNDRSLETERVILNILHCALMEAERGVMIAKQREMRKKTTMNASS